MQPSMFNLRVPLEARDEVFLMNTITDAQLVVSRDVAELLDRADKGEFIGAPVATPEEREALDLLWENGFLVENRTADRAALDSYLNTVKSNTDELNVTLLTTLQCNFACDYCFQGDHGDYNKFADKMSPEMAGRVSDWLDRELDRVRPERFVLTFFGGEPLLNIPVMYSIAERAWKATQARGVELYINIITNGLLLSEEVVDRLLPLGLNGIKITLDGDHDTHNRMRPLRGGQGTFDRIIENIRRVAGRCRIAIGGNFDEESVESFPALLEFLKAQDFADKLVKVNFKPIVRAEAKATQPKNVIPLTLVSANAKPLNGTCMTSVGVGRRHRLRQLRFRRRQDGVPSRGDRAPRLQDARRRAQRPVPRAHAARAHHRPRRLALSVPRVHRPARHLDRPHRRPQRRLSRIRARKVRTTLSVEGMRRLRLHPGVCRGLRRRLVQPARRHERADMSQTQL